MTDAAAHAPGFLCRSRDHRRRVPHLRRRLPHLALSLQRSRRSARARSRRASTRPGSPKATPWPSGARTARSGSSRCGAVCCAARSSCRSTTGPRRRSSIASPRSPMPASSWSATSSSRSALAAGRPVWPLTELRQPERASAEPLAPMTSSRPTPPRSSSRRARPRIRRAWSSPTRTSWPTSCRSSAKWRSTRRYARPFQPIRFLNLLPLSHMFGQAMATFVPPMLPGVVLFTRSYAP